MDGGREGKRILGEREGGRLEEREGTVGGREEGRDMASPRQLQWRAEAGMSAENRIEFGVFGRLQSSLTRVWVGNDLILK